MWRLNLILLQLNIKVLIDFYPLVYFSAFVIVELHFSSTWARPSTKFIELIKFILHKVDKLVLINHLVETGFKYLFEENPADAAKVLLTKLNVSATKSRVEHVRMFWNLNKKNVKHNNNILLVYVNSILQLLQYEIISFWSNIVRHGQSHPSNDRDQVFGFLP